MTSLLFFLLIYFVLYCRVFKKSSPNSKVISYSFTVKIVFSKDSSVNKNIAIVLSAFKTFGCHYHEFKDMTSDT